MTAESSRTAAITGADGYLGGLIRERLAATGWNTYALVRAPRVGNTNAVRFDLGGAPPSAALRSVNLLVHCAYDSSLVHYHDVERVNVEGSRRLLRAAREAQVARTIVVSSMSAYPGTSQLYGRAKLAIESAAKEVGASVVRPGVVYGPQPRGIAGGLQRLTRLPLVPVLADRYRQYLVHEEDFLSAITALVEAPIVPTSPLSIAHPTPVPMRCLLEGLARAEGRRCRFVPVAWRTVYFALRAGELLRVRLPFRADSLLGLVRPAPGLVGTESLAHLGVRVRAFEGASARIACDSG